MNGINFLKAVVAGAVKSVRVTPTNTLQISMANGEQTFLAATDTGKPFRFKSLDRATLFVSCLKVEVLQ